MLKAKEKTLSSVRRTIAKAILANELCRYVGYPDSVAGLDDLIEAAQETQERAYSFGSILRVNFRGAGSDCDISIDAEHADRLYDYTDDEGNQRALYNLKFSVSWPSHGGTSITNSMARLNFYTRITNFAAELQATYASDAVDGISRSAKQLAEDKEREEKLRINALLAAALIEAGAGTIRLGSERQFKVNNDVPPATYEVWVDLNKHGRKKYTCFVAPSGDANAIRTK